MRNLNHDHPRAGRLASATTSALTLSILAAAAETAPAPTVSTGPVKPAWLQEISLSVKESYDNNVFYSDVGSTRNRSSWITTVNPRIGVNLAPLVDKDGPLSVPGLWLRAGFCHFPRRIQRELQCASNLPGAQRQSRRLFCLLGERF